MEENNIETLDTNTPVQPVEPVTSVEPTPVAPVAPVEEPTLVTPVEEPAPTPIAPQPTPVQPVAPQPVRPETTTIPANYAPISAWGYVGYELLFCIPIVGFILMIVFSFNNSNINRKNFARSYFIYFIFGLIITIIVFVLAAVFGFSLNTIRYY